MRIGYDLIMLDVDKTLPKDPDEVSDGSTGARQ